jgi:hypothetical protein
MKREEGGGEGRGRAKAQTRDGGHKKEIKVGFFAKLLEQILHTSQPITSRIKLMCCVADLGGE